MHFPNVVKNFMRRAFKNLLPTKENLLRKKVVAELAAAEATAAFFGVGFGQEKGVQQMILEGDAKQITDAIQDKGRNSSMIGHLIDVKLCLNALTRWQVNHVYREANRVAHGLAKLVLNQVNETVWLEKCPSCIKNILGIIIFCSYKLQCLDTFPNFKKI